jgi:hypothetical protein
VHFERSLALLEETGAQPELALLTPTFDWESYVRSAGVPPLKKLSVDVPDSSAQECEHPHLGRDFAQRSR